MTKTRGLLFAAVSAFVLAAGAAQANPIAVVNASFETLPQGGLPFSAAGGASYSFAAIPGWVESSSGGQFEPSPTGAANVYFTDPTPDGLVTAFSESGTISQTVGVTAVAGATYTLQVDVGFRTDDSATGLIGLMIGSNLFEGPALAAADQGHWVNETFTYTATTADAGQAITIVLDNQGDRSQANFDNVRLSDDQSGAVPEPASWALMLLGFGGLGVALRTRRRAVPA